MKIYLCLIPLLFSLPAGFSPAVEEDPGRIELPEAAYDRTVALVALRRVGPERIRENLALLNRNWGIFPTLQYLELPVGEGGGELLFLRGRQEEVAQAARIAEEMDRIYPGPTDPVTLSPIPLGHLSGPTMRKQLLALSRESGLELKPEQLLLFPPVQEIHVVCVRIKSVIAQPGLLRREYEQEDRKRYEEYDYCKGGFLLRDYFRALGEQPAFHGGFRPAASGSRGSIFCRFRRIASACL